MNVESYACDFLRDRGYRAGLDYDAHTCIDLAARVLTEDAMQMTLAELRWMAAMAQFSPRELRADVLKLIEESANLAGDTCISMDATSVQIIGKETHA